MADILYPVKAVRSEETKYPPQRVIEDYALHDE
jgi:hypothetical protein